MTSSASKQVLHGGAERQPVRWINVDRPPMTISRYRVAVGASVSLHVHTGKAEYWLVVVGSGVVHIGEQQIAVQEGDVVATPPGVPHALHNTGAVVLDFVNVVERVGNEPVTTRELA